MAHENATARPWMTNASKKASFQPYGASILQHSSEEPSHPYLIVQGLRDADAVLIVEAVNFHETALRMKAAILRLDRAEHSSGSTSTYREAVQALLDIAAELKGAD